MLRSASVLSRCAMAKLVATWPASRPPMNGAAQSLWARAGVATIPRQSPGRSPTRATVVHTRFHSRCIVLLLLPARRAGETELTSDGDLSLIHRGDPLDRSRHVACPFVQYLRGEPRTAGQRGQD